MQPIQLRDLDPNGVQPVSPPSNTGSFARTLSRYLPSRQSILRTYALSDEYYGALVLNLVYGPNGVIATTILVHLSKMLAAISASLQLPLIELVEAAIYMFCIVDVFNDGLPRAAWTTIGFGDIGNLTTTEKIHRISLIHTLITVQIVVGIVLSVVLFATAPYFAVLFAPVELHGISTTFLRISAFNALPSAIIAAAGNGVRAYGRSFLANFIHVIPIALQMSFMIGLTTHKYPGLDSVYPSITGFAVAPLAGGLVATPLVLTTLLCFTRFQLLAREDYRRAVWFSYPLFLELLESGKWTFLESAIRNAVYMWQAHSLISLGTGSSLIWAMFNIIHRQSVDIPIRSLQLTSTTFVSQNWGRYLNKKKNENAGGTVTDGNTDGGSEGLRRQDVASWSDIREIIFPALKSTVVGLMMTLPLVIWLSVDGAKSNATEFGLESLAEWVSGLWPVVGMGFVLWSVASQIGCCIMIVSPKWYFIQTLVLTVLYSLPCNIALTTLKRTLGHAQIWGYTKWMLAGSYVFGTLIVTIVFAIWVAKMRGSSFLLKFKRSNCRD